ncbi:MAG: dipeptidase [Burkholderiales bacterium]|nr:dipeptidase [Anaerolineae bacterium]
MVTALEYAQSHHEQFLEQLEAFVRIPSVSTDPAHAEDVRRAAEWLADDMRRIGITAEIVPTKGHPIVYGEWLGAGEPAPTALVYAHYDVQPAIKSDGWDTEPFEPYRVDGKVYGRGVADDKGHSLLVVKALECYLASGTPCPINLKFLIEGEEESGSANFATFVRENTERLKADTCIVADSGLTRADQPDIYYGIRGITSVEFRVRGPKTDLHSGVHGGYVHNPAQVVAEMVAKLHNDDGSVAVPGFYDTVRLLPEAERAELNKNDLTAQDWADFVGAPQAWGEPGYTLLERATTRPTLEINGISGGYAGDGMKTVIPAQASAKITCRLVADQKPEQIGALVRDYLYQIVPPTVTLEVEVHAGGEPVTVPIDSAPVQALVRAFRYHWDAAPHFKRTGGTLPILSVFQEELKLPSVMLGFSLVDSGIHGPNEHFHIDLFYKGLDTLIVLYEELAVS